MGRQTAVYLTSVLPWRPCTETVLGVATDLTWKTAPINASEVGLTLRGCKISIGDLFSGLRHAHTAESRTMVHRAPQDSIWILEPEGAANAPHRVIYPAAAARVKKGDWWWYFATRKLKIRVPTLSMFEMIGAGAISAWADVRRKNGSVNASHCWVIVASGPTKGPDQLEGVSLGKSVRLSCNVRQPQHSQ